MQEGQQLSVCNRGLQAELHAVKVRKIALREPSLYRGANWLL